VLVAALGVLVGQRRLDAEVEVLRPGHLEEKDFDEDLGDRLVERLNDASDLLVGFLVGDDDDRVGFGVVWTMVSPATWVPMVS